ncbi:MAG: Crp/Fnr family transcriptional regulator [Candidatus Baltobacteraceae bacterium]
MIEPERHRRTDYGNRMLDALGLLETDRLAPFLRRVFLQRDQVMESPGETITNLHFPIDAFAWAWTQSTGSERPTSVLTVGRRGVIEWGRVLKSNQGQTCVTVVSPGSAWRLPVEIFDSLPLESALRHMLLRYANSCILNSACRLACNSEHNVDQRLARWLLWVADESAHTEFSITHQQIAEIAAIRRPSVSLALSQFQRAGFVRSQHGRLRLLDRERLEQLVCRCYWILRENCEDVFKAA